MNIASFISSLLQAETELINPVWYLASAVLFALIPVAVGLLTSYVKISIVLGIIKNALGTQHAPGAMVTLALSLALTGLTMNPVIKETVEISKTLDYAIISKSPSLEVIAALSPLLSPWELFLRKNTGKRELAALSLAVNRSPEKAEEEIDIQQKIEFSLLLPAFLLTELKEGFSMAFIVLLPFLAIDLIVSNILMGLGMMMVSPVLISLPIKLILFVISDSWLLIAQGLIRSYQI
jgi:type III secretory pathway component EscR